MALDLVSQLFSLRNLLDKNNTTTSSYNISSSLTIRVNNIRVGVEGASETKPVSNLEYPVVFCELKSSEDEYSELGNTARRDVTMRFNIISVINTGPNTSTMSDVQEACSMESIRLTQNIENLLRNKITLSSTVDHCRVETVDYNIKYNEQQTYNVVSRIAVICKKLTT